MVKITYSVYPFFGDAGVVVVEAESLLTALEKALRCRVESVPQVCISVYNLRGDEMSFYGIIGAMGRQIDNAIICAATVVTHQADDDRRAADVDDLMTTLKARGFNAVKVSFNNQSHNAI